MIPATMQSPASKIPFEAVNTSLTGAISEAFRALKLYQNTIAENNLVVIFDIQTGYNLKESQFYCVITTESSQFSIAGIYNFYSQFEKAL